MAFMRCLFFLLVVCASCGCASSKVQQVYTGPRLPMTEVAWLEIPRTVVLLEIDNQVIVRRRAGGSVGLYELRPGQHRLLVRYDDIWPVTQHDLDNHDTVRSGSVVMTVDLAAGRQYYLAHDRPESIEDARRMALDFKPDIRQKDIISASATVPAVKVRIAPGSRRADDDLRVPALTPSDVKVISPLDKLIYWWEKASPEQRKLFIQNVDV